MGQAKENINNTKESDSELGLRVCAQIVTICSETGIYWYMHISHNINQLVDRVSVETTMLGMIDNCQNMQCITPCCVWGCVARPDQSECRWWARSNQCGLYLKQVRRWLKMKGKVRRHQVARMRMVGEEKKVKIDRNEQCDWSLNGIWRKLGNDTALPCSGLNLHFSVHSNIYHIPDELEW